MQWHFGSWQDKRPREGRRKNLIFPEIYWRYCLIDSLSFKNDVFWCWPFRIAETLKDYLKWNIKKAWHIKVEA